MSKENVIDFKSPKFYLEFCVYDYNENDTTVQLEIGCGEDIESYMRYYFEESWDDLFFNKLPYSISDIGYVVVEGICINAKEDGCKLSVSIPSRGSWHHNFAKVSFDPNVIKDENANKIQQIKEILK
jgi:hypothetical protein